MVTSPDAFTGQNFRRGGYLDPEDRYVRAAEFVQVARELWESWLPGAIIADKGAARFLAGDAGGGPGSFGYAGENFDVSRELQRPEKRRRSTR